MPVPVSVPCSNNYKSNHNNNDNMPTSQQHSAQFLPPSSVHFRRRARRGKKRRCHEPMMSTQSQSLPQTTTAHHRGGGGTRNGNHPLKKRCIQIRPADVPQAPANFTQFIIDDHFGSCPGLYKSFETPPVGGPDSSSDSEAPHSSVNYDSESSVDAPLDYSDMVAFYEKDFEEVYSDAHAAEVIELPREQLVAMYGDLEKRAAELSSELSVYSPQHLLDLLQQRLLQLQEENRQLRAKNRALRYAHSEHSDDSQGSVDSETDSSSTSSDSSESSDSSDEDASGGVQNDNGAAVACSRGRRSGPEIGEGVHAVVEQLRHGQVAPDCVDDVNDNAMFQLDSSSRFSGGDDGNDDNNSVHDEREEGGSSARSSYCQRRGLHCSFNNDGSSSTLDFRSFQDALFSQSHSPTTRRTTSPSGSMATTAAATSSRSQIDFFGEDQNRRTPAGLAASRVAPQGRRYFSNDVDVNADVDDKRDDDDDGDEAPMRVFKAGQLLQDRRQQQHEQEVQVTSSCKTPVSDSSPPYGEIEAMG
ncbi:suppressor protein SRP40-like [Varroa jacobsoni]|uniref:suppressor protein SRP40-like n=1 Tax=Varroa jacobsoni TaxID=62625 RepID=UPI000BF76BA9|nr:suppressor protein SRP40-like [Varroa jacobsoni]